MHLGCVDRAYGYGICNIHVAYIYIYIYIYQKELLRHQYLLEDCYLYGIYRHNCILAARLLYTVISEIISSLSTITWFFHAPDQTIKSKFTTGLKKWNTPSPHKACVLLFSILLYVWQLKQCSYHVCFLGQLLMLRHAASHSTSCRCAACQLLPI